MCCGFVLFEGRRTLRVAYHIFTLNCRGTACAVSTRVGAGRGERGHKLVHKSVSTNASIDLFSYLFLFDPEDNSWTLPLLLSVRVFFGGCEAVMFFGCSFRSIFSYLVTNDQRPLIGSKMGQSFFKMHCSLKRV